MTSVILDDDETIHDMIYVNMPEKILIKYAYLHSEGK